VRYGLGYRYEAGINAQEAVARVVEDIGHLFGREAGVYRVADRADASEGIIKLHMAVAVPCQCRHAVAHLHAKRVEGMGQLRGAPKDFGVGGVVNIALVPDRDDALIDKGLGGVGEDINDPQRAMLHHAFHFSWSPP